jgi:hypothetical protein
MSRAVGKTGQPSRRPKAAACTQAGFVARFDRTHLPYFVIRGLDRAGPEENRLHTRIPNMADRDPDKIVGMARAKIVRPTTSPFRLDLTVWALRRREKNAIDRWDGGQYTRIIVFDNSPIQLTITQETTSIEPKLIVTIESRVGIDERMKHEVGFLVDKMLGLTIDLQPFYLLANSNDSLQPLVEQFFGVKPPRFASVFEGLINSIACQQVTLDLGILLLNRLSEKLGMELVDHGVARHAFPAPADLAEASNEGLRELGLSYQKSASNEGACRECRRQHARPRKT